MENISELFPKCSKSFVNRLNSSKNKFEAFLKFLEIHGDLRALPKISIYKFLEDLGVG